MKSEDPAQNVQPPSPANPGRHLGWIGAAATTAATVFAVSISVLSSIDPEMRGLKLALASLVAGIGAGWTVWVQQRFGKPGYVRRLGAALSLLAVPFVLTSVLQEDSDESSSSTSTAAQNSEGEFRVQIRSVEGESGPGGPQYSFVKPVVEGTSASASINSEITSTYDNLISSYVASHPVEVDSTTSSSAELQPSFDLDYEVIGLTPVALSIRVHSSLSTGVGQYDFYYPLNFVPATGDIIYPTEVYDASVDWRSTVSDLLCGQILGRVERDSAGVPDPCEFDLDFLTDPMRFNISSEGVVYSFSECELVACAFSDLMEFTIPMLSLKGVLDPEGPLGAALP